MNFKKPTDTIPACAKLRRRFPCGISNARVLSFLVTILCAANALADSQNFLYKIGVKPASDHTRLTFMLEKESDFSLSVLPGNRLKLILPNTSSVQSKKLRAYKDRHIDGISFVERANNSSITIALAEKDAGYRLIATGRTSLVTIDVGPGITMPRRELHPDREKIWSGTEQLIREFEPPLRPDVPFIPTDGKLLRSFLSNHDAELFLRGEAALYREKPAEAEEIFSRFLDKESPVRTIAAYRMGEALYMTQKYSAALAVFRQAEKLNPEYIVQNPSAIFYYADSLVRGGDFEAGRKLLVRLIIGLSGTDHGPPLLVRLADMYAHAGREKEALAIYKNVVANFHGSKAFYSASMRLNDREFFKVNALTYKDLIKKYALISTSGTDLSLQEESLFKAALLEALYGQAEDAVAVVAEYERKYPFGIFANVAKTLREDLLFILYHELKQSGDCLKLLGIVDKNRNYLAKCLAEEGFVTFVSKCFTGQGMAREEMKLFLEIADSEWATGSAPFLYSRIIDNALAFGDEALAVGTAGKFLERFPRHPLVWGIIGTLGGIYYRKGDMYGVALVLARIEEKGSRVEDPVSFYYLGKARERFREFAAADKNMVSFQNELDKRGLTSPLIADSFLVRAAARLAKGDRKGAMAMYRAGYTAAEGEMRDALLFKMGDLSRQEGNYAQAKESWEKLLSEGNDRVWKDIASRELADLEWRKKWKY